MMRSLSKRAVQRAVRLGFTQPFIADVTVNTKLQSLRLDQFLRSNFHGTMSWMEETKERRASPSNLWPQARSAIVLGMNYGADLDPLANLEHPEKATISVYARNRDYHDIMKGRLKEIAGLIAGDHDCEVKVFVDTAPLMEKPLAQKAGLGWQGKHTNLVSREFGSWLFIGTILTDADIKPTQTEDDHCGSCRACLDICPTDAFPMSYQLDARKCISYLTIEHAGPVDETLRAKMGNRIYGCDDCLAVCPWNKFARSAQEIKLQARADLIAPDLADLAKLDDQAFRKQFSGSPVKRIGRNRFIRNVLYAIGNSGRPELRAAVQSHLDSDDPVVKDAAEWALSRLSS